MTQNTGRYRWFAPGDLNGFFGLMFDNLTVMSFLAGILVFGFGYPADIVYTRMFPGTAFGVLFGDLVYTWMAFRLARKTGRQVTAMPLGLDTPSTIGLALVVLGPAFVSLEELGDGGARGRAHDLAHRHGHHGPDRGDQARPLVRAGRGFRRSCPRPGLLGSIAGIALALIGFLPLLDIFGVPARRPRLPRPPPLQPGRADPPARERARASSPSVAVGTALYHVLGPAGAAGHPLPRARRRVPPGLSDADPRLPARASCPRSGTCPSPPPSRCSPSWAASTSRRARAWRATTTRRATSCSRRRWRRSWPACAAASPSRRRTSASPRTSRWGRAPATRC